jgi:hypothetical protein
MENLSFAVIPSMLAYDITDHSSHYAFYYHVHAIKIVFTVPSFSDLSLNTADYHRRIFW